MYYCMNRDGRPPGDLFLNYLLYTGLAAGRAQLLKQQKVRPVMKKGFTEIVFILDRSGSMSGLEADTIGGFNYSRQVYRLSEPFCRPCGGVRQDRDGTYKAF